MEIASWYTYLQYIKMNTVGTLHSLAPHPWIQAESNWKSILFVLNMCTFFLTIICKYYIITTIYVIYIVLGVICNLEMTESIPEYA